MIALSGYATRGLASHLDSVGGHGQSQERLDGKTVVNSLPRTGYGSVLVEIEFGSTEENKRARLVAAGHPFPGETFRGASLRLDPMAMAEAETKFHMEVEIGWLKDTLFRSVA